VVALAQPRALQPAGTRAVTLLLDASGSLPAEERARAEAFAAEAAGGSREDRLLALVEFGARPLLERRARAGPLEPLRSLVDEGATDIAAALRLGVAALPSGASGRLVLLSDGRANRGDLDRATDLIKARSLPVDVLPLSSGTGGDEAWLVALEAPARARVGQRIELEAVLRATTAGPARLQILREGELLADRRIQLREGTQQIRILDAADLPGPRRYLALLEAERDGRDENNQAAALTLVAGPPRILLVAETPARARAVEAALRAAGREVERVGPAEVPASAFDLAAYESILLVDLPARSLSASAMQAIQTAVHDLGRGLVMLGGRSSFAAGGWRETPLDVALPVSMQARADARRPDIALYFLIDSSSSMSEPGLAGPRGAVSKLDLAKEAVLQAAALLRPEDQLGVLSFDVAAHPVWPLQAAGEPNSGQRAAFEVAVLGIQAQGGTSLAGGMRPALAALVASDSARKQLLLLTDGWTEVGGLDAAGRLAREMAAAGLSLSVVGLGADSAPELADLAGQGGGRHYLAREPAEVPRLFVEETQFAMGSFMVEERFRPRPHPSSLAAGPVLRGLDAGALPDLDGYAAASARPSSSVDLWSEREDPILARWQYGLGRSLAWTSDLEGNWSADWLAWPEFGRFVNQMVDWTLPPPADSRLRLTLQTEGGGLTLRVETAAAETGTAETGTAETGTAETGTAETGAAETGAAATGAESGAPPFLRVDPLAPGKGPALVAVSAHLLGPEGSILDLDLDRVATDVFEGRIDALPAEGAWLLRLGARDALGIEQASLTAGFVQPLAPEFSDLAASKADPRILELAAATGGREIRSPDEIWEPVAGVTTAQDLWPWLLLAAALLFPADVALRRPGLVLPWRRDGDRDSGRDD
jgi:Mg-chelatase subunit ChlD